jgi:ATP-dependent DNA helicase RecQ
MKDQCDALIARGLPCCRLDSSLDAHDARAVYDQLSKGLIGMLYVSPERFNNERFTR